ncbi:MAG: universal stress protein [Salinivenus sp.]
MLPFGELFGLVSPATRAAVLREGERLSDAWGAHLYVAPTQGASPADLDQLVQWCRERREGEEGGASRDASEETRGGEGLVVAGQPEARTAVPPLDDPFLREHLKHGTQSMFVVHPGTTPDTIQHILVPTDFSAAAVESVHCALGLASIYNARVVLLHVVEESPYIALTRRDRLSMGPAALPQYRARRRLQQCIRAQGAQEVPVDRQIRLGAAAEQIGEAAGQEDIDLLVLAARGAGAVDGAALGSVAERVLQRVSGPLFLHRTSHGQHAPSN